MANFRYEIELMMKRLKSLESKNRQLEARLRPFINQSPYQNMPVRAEADILPDEVGRCVALYRQADGSSPYLKLKSREVLKFDVYNHRKTPIWEGEEFHVARDIWGDYYRIRDREEYTSFFLTPDTGLPAAPSKFHPYLATPCERLYFDKRAKEIKPLIDESTGDPDLGMVFNHTQNEVGGDLIIQAKKIDGHWFIDVEPCPAEEG
jgi:hypothetical protein